ncbi:Uncharacterized protein Adt_03835 [Abeliophyllum distichum]|uniref:Uncharacterized protein n=1 Tax=Abeliophyllum distichum TaxID=126358 RepID=A0ABD1VZW7_9LAMI
MEDYLYSKKMYQLLDEKLETMNDDDWNLLDTKGRGYEKNFNKDNSRVKSKNDKSKSRNRRVLNVEIVRYYAKNGIKMKRSIPGMDYNIANMMGEVEFISDIEGSAHLDDQQKWYKWASTNTRKTPLEEDTLADDDHFSIVDANMEAELMVEYVNETFCTNFADKDAIIIKNSMLAFQRQAISMGELLHGAVRKAQAEAEQATRALMDEREAMKKLLATADARLKKESGALHDCHVQLERASINAVESYKSSDEFQSCMRKFGAESVREVMIQIKAWVARDHPNIDPSGFDNFLKETYPTGASSRV